MISVEDTYPGRTVPGNANYPEGAVMNETVPATSNDGTPLDQAWGNDFEGLKQAIARSASIIPTVPGNVSDTALASQILQGLIEIAQGRATNYNDSGVANAYVLNAQANQHAPASLFDGQIFEFIAANTNTVASTANPVGKGIKNIVGTGGAGVITAGNRIRLRYRLSTGDFEIIKSSELPASLTVQGIIELATQTEVDAGTDAVRAVTPATLNGRTATVAKTGIIELATQTEVDAGTDPARAVTPATMTGYARVAKAWALFAGSTGNINSSSNISSITYSGVGDYTINFSAPLASTAYAVSVGVHDTAGVLRDVGGHVDTATLVGSFGVRTVRGTGGDTGIATNFANVSIIVFGA